MNCVCHARFCPFEAAEVADFHKVSIPGAGIVVGYVAPQTLYLDLEGWAQ